MEQLESFLDIAATPMQKIVIIDIINIFNNVNFTGYLYALEAVLAKIENNEIELSSALDNIFTLVIDQCYDVAINFGITLEPNINVRDLYVIIDAIVSIEDIEDKKWMLDKLKSDMDDIDKIVMLMSHHNPTISEDIFYESITRVKPSLIKKLIEVTEGIQEEQEIQQFDIGPSIKLILSLISIINEKYKNNEQVLSRFYVDRLIKTLKKERLFELRNDYIRNPKEDGYKSIHLIGKFKNSEGELRSIELQIRTKVQHSWATAVEIVDLFTNQSLKSNSGKTIWKDFFKHTSEQFALLENSLYLNSSENNNLIFRDFLEEFKKLNKEYLKYSIYKVFGSCNKLNIIKNFTLFTNSLQITSEQLKNNTSNGYILIIIETILIGMYSDAFTCIKEDE
mgnify:CR=1 FL=1